MFFYLGLGKYQAVVPFHLQKQLSKITLSCK